MNATLRKRPKVGDVIEIEVDGQLSYAHFTHRHRMYGALVRVAAERFRSRPPSFDWVSKAELQFETFFPLGAAVSRDCVAIAGTAAVCPERQAFPIFRATARTSSMHGPWWLWDGEREWMIDSLEPGMEKLPIRGVINDTLLIARIRSGWRAEHEA